MTVTDETGNANNNEGEDVTAVEDDRLGLEFKCVGISGFKALDGDPESDEEGVVEAIVSVTGLRDNVKDVIQPGAYEKSLKSRIPKGVWHHSWSESISRTEEIKELLPGDPDLPEKTPEGLDWPKEAGALKVKTRFNLNTQRGREAYEDVKFFGQDQNWSIGYSVPVGGATVDSKSGVRKIHTLDLYEYSPVLFGAMPSARTSSVKDAQMAYKSISGDGGAEDDPDPASDVDDADSTDDEDENGISESEYEQMELDLDIEPGEKMWGFLDDEGYFTKADPKQITVGPRQAQKIYRAVATLSELLRDMRVELEEEGVEPVEANDGSQQEKEPGGESSDQPDFSNTDLATLVGKVVDDKGAVTAAKEFDTAFANSDHDGMEEAADQIMDTVEAAIEDGASKDEFSDVGGYIAWAVEQAGEPKDEGDEKGSASKPEKDSGKGSKSDYQGADETFTIDPTEWKSLLQ